MKKHKITGLLIIVLLFQGIILQADGGDDSKIRYTISGHIKDAETGEDLIGATIYVDQLESGTTTNVYGYYALSMIPGNYTLTVSYIGFENQQKTIQLQEDVTWNIDMKIANQELEEVVVTSTAINDNVTRTEMSSINLDITSIRKIPAFMGEVDIIKAIQLLPGGRKRV